MVEFISNLNFVGISVGHKKLKFPSCKRNRD